MTLLTICDGLAKNVGMAPSTVIVTSPSREWQEALQYANETGEELARRVDWGQLYATTTLTGDGTALTHTLPADVARLNMGIAVRASGATVRPLSRAEWASITLVQGTPRYFLLEGRTIKLFPYLANAATATVGYQTTEWCSAGASFMADTDTSLIDEGLFLKGLIVRWRRQKGMPYADEEAEYEAALTDFAKFNDRARF